MPDADGMVKLDAMENPYPLPAGAARASSRRSLARVDVNRYPDAEPRRSCATRSRARMDVPAGMEVLLGNGSDELIQMLITALARPGAACCAPAPSFVMYSMGATFSGMRYVGGAAARGFLARRRRVHRARCEAEKPALVFHRLSEQSDRRALSARQTSSASSAPAPGLVVVDEAYHAFAGKSFLPRLAEFPTWS